MWSLRKASPPVYQGETGTRDMKWVKADWWSKMRRLLPSKAQFGLVWGRSGF